MNTNTIGILKTCAKVFAYISSISFSLIVLSTCKTWRRYIYISEYLDKRIHRTLTYTFIISGVAHSVVWGFLNANSRPVVTGLVVLGILAILITTVFVTAATRISYIYTCVIHLTLTALLVVAMYTHVYSTSGYWYLWILPGILLHIGESVYRNLLGGSVVTKVRIHSDNVLELKFSEKDLDDSYIGQTIWLKCPDIDLLEWHPFTVTSERSVYIKRRGDWTNKLYGDVYGDTKRRPQLQVLVDGPYKNIANYITKTIHVNDTVLVCSGIGITNFVSVLQQCCIIPPLKKLYVIVIVKNCDDITWLLPVITRLQCITNIHVNIWITDFTKPSKYTRYLSKYNVGRPDFQKLFHHIYTQSMQTNSRIHVFYSGKLELYTSIKRVLHDYDTFILH